MRVLTDIRDVIAAPAPIWIGDGLQAPRLYRIDATSQRWYYTLDKADPDDQFPTPIFMPSVTTCIDGAMPKDQQLFAWAVNTHEDMAAYAAYMKEKAHYGTLLHILFAEIMAGHPLRLGLGLQESVRGYAAMNDVDASMCTYWHEELSADLWALERWRRDYKVEPIALELTAHDGELAGTMDLLCQLTNDGLKQYAVIDLKSGCRNGQFYSSYKHQLIAYRGFAQMLLTELDPDVEPIHIYNLSPKDWNARSRTFYNFVEHEVSDRDLLIHIAMRVQFLTGLRQEQELKDDEELMPKIAMRTWSGVLDATADLDTLTRVLTTMDLVKLRHVDVYEKQQTLFGELA